MPTVGSGVGGAGTLGSLGDGGCGTMMVVPVGSLPLGGVLWPGARVVSSGGEGTVGPGATVVGLTVVGLTVVGLLVLPVVSPALVVLVVGAAVEPGGFVVPVESIFSHLRPNLFCEHSTAGM